MKRVIVGGISHETSTPGPVFSRLHEAWKQSVGIEFVAQARNYAERLPAWQQQV